MPREYWAVEAHWGTTYTIKPHKVFDLCDNEPEAKARALVLERMGYTVNYWPMHQGRAG